MNDAPPGPLAWLVLALDGRWPLILFGLLTLTLISGVVVAAPPGDRVERIPIGELVLETAVDDQGLPEDADMTVPSDGTMVRAVDVPTLTVAAHSPDHAASGDVHIDLIAARRVADGTLWRHVTTIDAAETGTASGQVDLGAVAQTIERIDDRLQTDSGTVTVELRAIARTETGQIAGEVATDLEIHDDYLVFTPAVRERVSTTTTQSAHPPLGASLVGMIGLVGTTGIGLARLTGTVPLDSTTAARYRLAAIRWRYRQRILEVATPIDTADAVRAVDPIAVARASRRTGRPLRLDAGGTVAVGVGDTTVAWWPPR